MNSQDCLETIVNGLSTPAILQHQGRLLLNPPARALLGYTEDEVGTLVGTLEEWFGILQRERAGDDRFAQEARRESDEVDPLIIPVRHSSGRELWVEVSGYVGESEDVFLLRNVTDQMQTLEALRQSEKRWRALAENLPGSVMELGIDGTVRWTNRPQEDRSREEIVGTSALTLLDEKRQEWLLAALPESSSEQPATFETEEPLPNGRSMWLEHRIVPLVDYGTRTGYVVHTLDVTEQHERERELREAIARLDKTLNGAVLAVSAALEKHDPYTAGHEIRVAKLASAIAEEMSRQDIADQVHLAASLHDIGKIGVPSEILCKPSRLSEVESLMVRTHSQIGYEILESIDFGWPLADVVHQHHERLDGSGYPQGLSGPEIPLEARIIAVADVVEAMSSHRPYRSALAIDVALREITTNKGTLYDEAVVDACVSLFAEGFSFSGRPRSEEPDVSFRRNDAVKAVAPHPS